jgi:hypothetical protein
MLSFKRKSLALLSTSLLALSALPSLAAAPSIVFSHNGKTVTSIPLDKLSELSVTVNTGGASFKQVFAGQWSGLDQAQTLKATHFKKGSAFPDLEKAHSWANLDLAVTSGDSTWGGVSSLNASMRKGAIELSLYRATSEHDLAFTSLFYRKDYTGKTKWENNGWVQETQWQALGKSLGQATLKLEPPTFAASLDPKVLFAPAVEKFNTEKPYDLTRAQGISQTLLYPTSYGGRKVNFEGSKVLEFSLAEGSKPVFNWNYVEKDKSEYIQAEMTVNMKIQAVMNTTMEALPIPTKMEAVFNCPINISAKRDLGASSWTVSDLEYNNEIRKTCKTADGKIAEDVIKGANPLGGFGF